MVFAVVFFLLLDVVLLVVGVGIFAASNFSTGRPGTLHFDRSGNNVCISLFLDQNKFLSEAC